MAEERKFKKLYCEKVEFIKLDTVSKEDEYSKFPSYDDALITEEWYKNNDLEQVQCTFKDLKGNRKFYMKKKFL